MMESATDSNLISVLVLARTYQTCLGVIRSLGMADFTVDLLYLSKQRGSSVIAASSRYVRQAHELVIGQLQHSSGEEVLSFLDRYAQSHSGKTVLFPTDDFTANLISVHAAILQEQFLIPNTAENAHPVSALMAKSFQCELARKAGMNVARSWTVDLESLVVPDEVCCPCIVKPVRSILGSKQEIRTCGSRQELMEHLRTIRSADAHRSVLVQEKLQVERELDLSGVCFGERVILPGVIEKDRIQQKDPGITVTGRLVPIDRLGETREPLVRFLAGLHYTGMFDLELLENSGKLYFNEINLRSGSPNFFYTQNGVNLPAIFVSGLLGQEAGKAALLPQNYGNTFVNEKAAWDDYIYGYLTREELESCLEKQTFSLLCDEADPRPGRVFRRRIRLSRLKHQLRSPGSTAAAGIPEKHCVVAGCNYINLLTTAKALRQAGYAVDLLRVYRSKIPFWKFLRRMEPERFSQAIHTRHTCIAGDSPETFVKALLQLRQEDRRVPLFCVDDYTLYLADAAYDQVREAFLTSNALRQGQICKLMQKALQKKIAAACGVPVLPDRVIHPLEHWEEAAERIGYPLLVKPNISFGSFKNDIRRCADSAQLARVLSGCEQKEKTEYLIEPYLDLKDEYSIIGISTPEEVIAPAVFRVTAAGHRARKGVAVAGETVEGSRFSELTGHCGEFLQRAGYTGLFDVDLLEDRNGNIFVSEFNFRAGSSMYVFARAGWNLPAMLAAYLEGGSIPRPKMPKEVPHLTFVNEKVLMEEYASGDLSRSEARSLLQKADVRFLADGDSPKPVRCFRRYIPAAFLLRSLRRMRTRRRAEPEHPGSRQTV